MLKKLRIRLIFLTMTLVFVLLCVIFGMIYVSTARQMEMDRLDLMHSLAGRPGLSGQKTPPIPDAYLILRQSPQGVWSAQGSDYFDLTDWDFLNALIEDVSSQQPRDGILTEHNLRYMRSDKPLRQYIFLDISEEQAALGHLVRNLCIIGVLSLLLFFGIILLLTNLALQPVEKAWAEQTQFVADASHELKTPLAVILTNAELLEDAGYSPQEHQQFESNIRTMARQMRHLVEGLLELTRLDNVMPDIAPLDLSALTENVTLPFEPVFFEQGMELSTRITPGLWVKGSSIHLQQVIEIFLDNALKYASGGQVILSLQQAGSHGLLVVESQGTPLSSQEAKDIFLRFYRTDPARKRDGSYGLGLSIAQKIVRQHGGKIWAEGTATGNRFSVLLPLDHRVIE